MSNMTARQAMRAATPNGKFGLYDTQDHCWIGNDEGPLRYDDFQVARLAAEASAAMLGWRIVRVRAVEYVKKGQPRLKDELPTVRSAEDALKALERGLL